MWLEGREGEKLLQGGWGGLRYGTVLHSMRHSQLIPNSEAPLLPTGWLGCSQPRGVSQEKTCSVQAAVGGEPREACVPGEPTSGDMGPGGDLPTAQRAQRGSQAPSRLSRANPGQSGQMRDVALRAKPGPVREAAGVQRLVHVRQFSQSHSYCGEQYGTS